MTEFDPAEVLRKLGYNKLYGKSNPPETLFWHSLNVYLCAKELSDLLPVPLTDEERGVLLWSALLHDSGKAEECWQEKGSGPHPLTTESESIIRGLIEKETGPLVKIQSTEDINIILELIREHHTRKSLSNGDTERVLSILKLADTIVSASTINLDITDSLKRRVQGYYKVIVLSAEEHPMGYVALSMADVAAKEQKGAIILLTNRLQSLYLLPATLDLNEFKYNIIEKIEDRINMAEERGRLLTNSGNPRYAPVPDSDYDSFLRRIHKDKGRIIEEMQSILTREEKKVSSRNRRDRTAAESEDALFSVPVRLLRQVVKKENLKKFTDATLPTELLDASPREVADQLGVKDPVDLIKKVADLIVSNTDIPSMEHIAVDVLRWSDDRIDASAISGVSYEYYRQRMWNSRDRRRTEDKYCFSCKRRPPIKEAPSISYLPTDTWSSSLVGKKKVMVCRLCYIAQKYFLPYTVGMGDSAESPYKKFRLDATPAYNHMRLKWPDVLSRGWKVEDWKRAEMSSHQIVFPLSAETPNEAMVEVLEENRDLSGEYPSYADFLYKNGLCGTIGAGPQNPGRFMLQEGGTRIEFKEWENYGRALRMLVDTNPQKVFPAAYTLGKLTDEWGWGSLLVSRYRNDRAKKKINAPKNREIVSELIKMKSSGGNNKMMNEVRNLPLWSGDRDKRFSSAERILRRMDRVTITAAKHEKDLARDERDIVEEIAQNGMKQLRSEVFKNSKKKEWPIRDEKLQEVEKSLFWIGEQLWSMKDSYRARGDFVNGVIMAIAYNPSKEEE